MNEAEKSMLTRITDIHMRRIKARRAAQSSSGDFHQAQADATTLEDLATLLEARNMLSMFENAVLDACVEIEQDWGRNRCAVCGMTPTQSEEANYDCIREC